jgi:hypothetical protein
MLAAVSMVCVHIYDYASMFVSCYGQTIPLTLSAACEVHGPTVATPTACRCHYSNKQSSGFQRETPAKCSARQTSARHTSSMQALGPVLQGACQ